MAKRTRRRRSKIAINLSSRFQPPGQVVAPPNAKATECTVFAFGNGKIQEEAITDVHRIREVRKLFPMVWVNVDGLSNAKLIQELGDVFGLHSLALEDAMNHHQLAKCEDYGDSLFFVSRMLNLSPQLESEQLCLFLGKDYVVSIQEFPGDCFDPVRDRIRKNKGPVTTGQPDYLAYSLLDAIVDSYFPIVDALADRLDEIEDQIASQLSKKVLRRLHIVRNDLLMSRRAIRPLRDAIGQLMRDPSPLIQKETKLFLRDCFDHCQQLIDLLETYRELCSDMREYHLSMVSFRMNEIMKVLTVIATIFMPLSFIASVYGMNFDTTKPLNMPELRWEYGYVFVWALMLVVTIAFGFYFWHRGWIFAKEIEDSENDTRS
jgi:magnesium transporter